MCEAWSTASEIMDAQQLLGRMTSGTQFIDSFLQLINEYLRKHWAKRKTGISHTFLGAHSLKRAIKESTRQGKEL